MNAIFEELVEVFNKDEICYYDKSKDMIRIHVRIHVITNTLIAICKS